jgi:SAM-dependent methyltransferase
VVRAGDNDGNLDTVDANRRFYAVAGEEYDRLEEIVASRKAQEQLREILTTAVSMAPKPTRALDACGGSGNASVMLHSLGVEPLTVDVSPEMLAIYERKAAAVGVEAHTHVQDIGAFLEDDPREWDLIVFSSALHHLDDYVGIMELAVARLAPRGILVTVFDPTATNAVGRRLRRLDYIVHVIVHEPRRAWAIIGRRLRRTGADKLTLLGARAERHALHGIDDVALERRLREMGLVIVAHRRTYGGRFGLTRLVYRLIHTPSTFSFTVQRPHLPSVAPAKAGDGERSPRRRG